MNWHAFLLLATVSALAATGCGRLGSTAEKDKQAVQQAYSEYRKAFLAGDVEGLKRSLAKEKRAELDAPDAAAKLAMAAALYPPKAQLTAIKVHGGNATISASGGKIEGGVARGTIDLVKEDGQWKVAQESWSIEIGTSATPTEAPQRDVQRPSEISQLRGTWQGPEIGAPVNWTLSIGDNWAVAAKSETGEWYRGEATVHFELGAEPDGSIRVPPGSGMLDVEVTEASQPGFEGKIALGAYFKEFDRLKLCLGVPGGTVRAKTYDASSAAMRCFQLAKTAETAQDAGTAQVRAEATATR